MELNRAKKLNIHYWEAILVTEETIISEEHPNTDAG